MCPPRAGLHQSQTCQASQRLLHGDRTATVLAAAFGYAEGGLLARELGAWQTISWALVLGLPLMLILTAVAWFQQPPVAGALQWGAFLYLGVVSMFLGFFAWYRGLGIGPMAKVSQIQLIQPVLTLLWAALLLGEQLTLATVAGGAAVVLCAGAAIRVRMAPARSPHDGKVRGKSSSVQEAK